MSQHYSNMNAAATRFAQACDRAKKAVEGFGKAMRLPGIERLFDDPRIMQIAVAYAMLGPRKSGWNRPIRVKRRLFGRWRQ